MTMVSDTPSKKPAITTGSERIAIERHRRGNRWMHWINFPLLTVMIWSGLRIYWADLRDPFVFGIFGWEIYEFFPDSVNEPLNLNRKLAWGLAFHFTFAWLFVINGLAFGAYLWRTKGYRNFLPTAADLKTIPHVLLHECGIRKDPPPQGKYNGVQQLSYAGVLVMGVLAIVSGFAIYKPTQLSLLTALLGGYSSARFIHFAVTIGFLLFFVIHLVQVGRAGLAAMFSMVTGYELLKPEVPTRNSTADVRASARIRDLISIALLPTMVVLFWAAVDSGENPNWFRAIVLSSVVLGFFWDALWVAWRGATPGKLVNGLKVVRVGTNDHKPTVVQSVSRALPWVALVLLFTGPMFLSSAGLALVITGTTISVLMVMIRPARRTVMDFLVGTEVIATAAIAVDNNADTENTDEPYVSEAKEVTT